MASQIPEIPRLQCVAPALASHVALCEPAQTAGVELIDRRYVPARRPRRAAGEP